MDELSIRCEDSDCLLSEEVEWREHRSRQAIRRRFVRKLEETTEYLDLHREKIVESQKWFRYGRMSFYVGLVREHASKLFTDVNEIFTDLCLEKNLPRAWLDRPSSLSSPEQGGKQYAGSGKRFGYEGSERSMCPVSRLEDSRLSDFIQHVKTRAPLSLMRAAVGAQPHIMLAHGQPCVGLSTLGYCALETFESQDGGSFFPDGCVYLPMKGDFSEAEFAEALLNYLAECIPRQCKYVPPSGSGAQPRLGEILDYFIPVLDGRRCIFLLDGVSPKRRSDGCGWKGNPLDAILKLASRAPKSLVLVCSSFRGAVDFSRYPAASATDDLISVPLAEHSFMEEVFCDAWKLEARMYVDGLIIENISELDPGWNSAATRVLAKCGGLPAAAAAAGASLFQRMHAGDGDAAILADLEGGVGQSMDPELGMPDILKANLAMSLKCCEDSVDQSTFLSVLNIYKLVGQTLPFWSDHGAGLLIRNWQLTPPASVLQVPLSAICDHVPGGEATVRRRLNELNKYIPICVSDLGGIKSVLMCPMFHDHANSL